MHSHRLYLPPASQVLLQLRAALSTDTNPKPLENIHLFCGDATRYRDNNNNLQYPQSHIYCYDTAFNEDTLEGVLEMLKRSPNWLIYASFSSPIKLNKFGCSQWMNLLGKQKVNTTGKQSFTIYFYSRMVEVVKNNKNSKYWSTRLLCLQNVIVVL